MRGTLLASCTAGALLLASGSLVHSGTVERRTPWADVDLTAEVPESLRRPEGRTRWDLASLKLGPHWERRVEFETDAGGATWLDRRSTVEGPATAPSRYRDSGDERGAERWLLPERDPDLWKPARVVVTRLAVDGADGRRSLWIRSERAGLGWIILPSGPHEVVLQRSLVLARPEGATAFGPERLVYRWIDRRVGVVAQVSGPVAHDGATLAEIADAAVLAGPTAIEANEKLYIDQVDRPLRTNVRFGWDRHRSGEPAVPISSLTPDAPVNMAALVAAGSWDFSGNNLTNYPGMNEIDSFTVEIADTQSIAAQTNECGFTDNASRKLGREDRFFADGAFDVTLSVTERKDGVTSPGRIDLVAAHRNEGEGGTGLEAEARTCHDPTTGRTAIPLWSFTHPDAGGYYAMVGDQWQSDPPFNCQQIIWTNAIISDRLWVKSAASSSIGPLSGRQQGQVVAEGPVTLPSGHTFNSVVARTWVEYNTFGGSSCLFAFSPVRTVVHLWEVPSIGTVVRLQSANDVTGVDNFTAVEETDIKYGLFPPRGITVEGTGGDSVALSWDPGLLTDEISRYRIYWDTDSGAVSPYAFDSDTHPGQVAFAGTTAVVSGLTPGVPHYFTVTSVRDYCEPGLCANNACAPACPGAPPSPCPPIQCNVVTPVESLVFPTQVSGGPSPVPAEVTATPGGLCVPTEEVTNLMLSKTAGGIEMCWDLSADPCAEGYQILGGGAPTSDAEFSVLVEDTGPTNCWTFDPAATYLLVVAKGSGGTGPWGHFGH